MKIAEAMKTIDDNWIKKKKGFRVHIQRFEGATWVVDYSPGEKAGPLDSDVTSWRLAWKLAQSTPLRVGDFQDGDMINVFVVDQDNSPIIYYATGKKEIFNKYSV